MKPLSLSTAILWILIFSSFPLAQDSLDVVKVGEILYWHDAYDIEIAGCYAYIADGMGGLRLVNINDPENPIPVSYCDTPGSARGVALSWVYAYVADGDSGLQIINVADPYAPVRTNSFDLPDFAHSLAVSGNYAFVAADSAGLRVVDISYALNPFEVSHFDTPGEANDVVISGNYAYVADGDSGLRVLDIANPISPIEIGHCDLPGYAYEVDIGGIYAYVANGSQGLRIVNIADPAAPIEAGFYQMSNTKSVDAVGDVAFIGGYDFRAIDVSNPLVPFYLDYIDLGYGLLGIKIWGTYAYTANGSSGLITVDVLDPEDLIVAGSCGERQWGTDVAILGDYAYVTGSNDPLKIIDISQNNNPQLVGEFEEFYYYYSIVTKWTDQVYAVGPYGITSIDVSDPVNPILLDTLCLAGNSYDICLWGNKGYIAASSMGLFIVDISDPDSLFVVGHYDTPGYARSLDVCGSYVYIADADSGLRIIDVSDPTAPSEVGVWKSGNSIDFVEYATYAEVAIADADTIIRRINVWDPTSPYEINSVVTPDHIASIYSNYWHFFIANDYEGIRMYDMELNELAYYDTPYRALDLAVQGSAYIYVADGYDFSIYYWMEPVGVIDGGLQPVPTTISLLPPHPNPFNATTKITFSLPVRSYVKLDVFDISGRIVGARHASPLPDGWYSPGTHTLLFDGSNLASGIYILRLQAGEYNASQKMVLLK